MKRRSAFRLLLLGLCTVALLATSWSPGAAAPVTIKFAHVAPVDDPRHQAALKFKELVETRSKGTIKVEVYYGGQLGGDRDAIEGLRLGTVQMTTAGAGIYALFEPKMGITALPFLFANLEEAWKFVDGPVNAEVTNLLISKGIRGLAYWENGFRCITNSVRPIKTVADLKGLKIRTPENPVILSTMKALGANPVPMAWGEVYVALQQGAIDGQENPIPLIYSSKLYEVQKYLAVTNHVYEPLLTAISERFWQTLTPEQRKIVAEAAVEAGTFHRQLVKKQTEQLVEVLKEKGMQVTYPDLKPFRQATANVRDQFVGVFGRDLINKAYGLR